MTLRVKRELGGTPTQIKYWLVTIRKHQVKDFVHPTELDECITYIDKCDYLVIRDYCYEGHGLYKQYHCHALIETPKFFRFRGLTKYKGFTIHWKAISGRPDKVCMYIHKHCNNHCPHRILQNELANFFRYHNLLV